ncbi:Nicotinate-nucleotide-dimethylbenzimidazole phosphoribosyltransferase [Methanococcus vannielii SB]|jgi:uncharacterized protein (TIGR00303 family)|uniref:UPF0284 protein Mevan_1349 n=1 Tax=Methanococcus vannielii (strain ATCC 35089 / DSM 1224 / JCM 13029 / OCM 148 / SB) TaxID=406327 RepID=A6URX4_METVS|nr:TIGR00303 family protein [Methanococcus vannielii]ABR55246.1 Nicotinate-nucleotide-dimethylbenzimidazole phosphoribosyltransferase [Methanococcus vannielii SB]
MPVISINENGFLEKLKKTKGLFSCVISSIETTKYVPISGVNKSVIDYTPAADMELVTLGKSLSLNHPPIDATGCPSPATITRAAVDLLDLPVLTVDAGSYVKPKIPYVSIDEKPTGDIRYGLAMDNSKELFRSGKILSKNTIYESLIVGESVPGGTTTALGVLLGLGYDAKDKISSGSVENPKELKLSVVESGIKNSKSNDVFDILNAVGDKMMPVVAGMAISAVLKNKPVLLAGGTQMASVLAVINEINPKILKSGLIGISTTEFVLNDKNADLKNIIEQIGDVPLFASKFGYENSKIDGLKAYCKGSVKEGVGAGGISTYSYLNGLNPKDIRYYVEENYEIWYSNFIK